MGQKDVGEPDVHDQVAQGFAGVVNEDAAAQPLGGELQATQFLNGGEVRSAHCSCATSVAVRTDEHCTTLVGIVPPLSVLTDRSIGRRGLIATGGLHATVLRRD